MEMLYDRQGPARPVSSVNVQAAVSEGPNVKDNVDKSVQVTRTFHLTSDNKTLANVIYEVQNHLYIWFYKSNNVQVVTLDGRLVKIIRLHSSIASDVYIQSMCVSAEDRTFWSATSTGRIQQTAFDGRELHTIEKFVSENEVHMKLGLYRKNTLIIGMFFNGHVVLVINKHGEIMKSLYSENIGLTASPFHIRKCNKSGNMAFLEWSKENYISVTDKNFKHLYNLYGNKITLPNGTTASTGYKCNGRFLPWFTCFDVNGNLIVSEADSCRIVLFSGNGDFIRILTKDTEVTSRPSCIASYSDGLLWIAQENDQIKQIRYDVRTEGLAIAELVKGRIELQTADVIVCAVDNSLNLAASGTVAKCLLAVGGKTLITECKSKCSSGIKYDEILSIESGNLKCKKVYLMTLPDFVVEGRNRGGNKGEIAATDKKQILQRAISKILDKAIQDQMKSIAFPAIGISKMNLSIESVARIMFNTIKEKTLEFEDIVDVKFVLQDREVIKVFEDMEKEILKGVLLIEKAIMDNDLSTLRSLVSKEYGLNENKKSTLNILYIAAAKGTVDSCQYLIDKDFPTNCLSLHISILRLLSNMDGLLDEISPLTVAILNNKTGNTRLLLEHTNDNIIEKCNALSVDSDNLAIKELKRLKMGLDVSSEDRNSRGTIGPFVDINGQAGFITSAILFFDVNDSPIYWEDTPTNRIPVFTNLFGSLSTDKDLCGYVKKAVFDPNLPTGIDAALVELCDPFRIPQAGEFHIKEKKIYNEAGFDKTPLFNSGALKNITDISPFSTVIKCGSTTSLTRGVLVCNGPQVELFTRNVWFSSRKSLLMNNQIEIEGLANNRSFCEAGDTGSAVFTVNVDKSLACIGMAIASTPEGRAIVTPIEHILEAIGPNVTLKRFDNSHV